MKQTITAKEPILLPQVASLTSIRDIEIFEFSLLNTLAGILKTQSLSIYKFNDIKTACRLIRFATKSKQTNKQTNKQ
jgi:hypothetical protein